MNFCSLWGVRYFPLSNDSLCVDDISYPLGNVKITVLI
jgi:hypothetical protein